MAQGINYDRAFGALMQNVVASVNANLKIGKQLPEGLKSLLLNVFSGRLGTDLYEGKARSDLGKLFVHGLGSLTSEDLNQMAEYLYPEKSAAEQKGIANSYRVFGERKNPVLINEAIKNIPILDIYPKGTKISALKDIAENLKSIIEQEGQEQTAIPELELPPEEMVIQEPEEGKEEVAADIVEKWRVKRKKAAKIPGAYMSRGEYIRITDVQNLPPEIRAGYPASKYFFLNGVNPDIGIKIAPSIDKILEKIPTLPGNLFSVTRGKNITMRIPKMLYNGNYAVHPPNASVIITHLVSLLWSLLGLGGLPPAIFSRIVRGYLKVIAGAEETENFSTVLINKLLETLKANYPSFIGLLVLKLQRAKEYRVELAKAKTDAAKERQIEGVTRRAIDKNPEIVIPLIRDVFSNIATKYTPELFATLENMLEESRFNKKTESHQLGEKAVKANTKYRTAQESNI